MPDETPPTSGDDGPAPEGEAGASAPAGRRTVPVQAVVTAVAVLVAVAAVVFALSQRSDAGRLSDEADARAEVAAAAGRFGEVYLSYDTGDVAASSERVLELVSAEFARDFQSNRAPGVEEIFANLGTTTEAETTQVFVGTVSESRASVLVVVDVVARSEASGTQVLSDLSFLVDLVREDGRWLVDDVLPAPQPDVSGDGVDDTTTTTTAPPAP